MLEQQVLNQVNDQMSILGLRLEKLEQTFAKHEQQTDAQKQKIQLDIIHKELERANSEVKSLLFEIKKVSEPDATRLSNMLKQQRAKLGDYEIQYTTFKRNIKFTLELAQEREDLEQIDDKIGAMDDEEVGQIDL